MYILVNMSVVVTLNDTLQRSQIIAILKCTVKIPLQLFNISCWHSFDLNTPLKNAFENSKLYVILQTLTLVIISHSRNCLNVLEKQSQQKNLKFRNCPKLPSPLFRQQCSEINYSYFQCPPPKKKSYIKTLNWIWTNPRWP